MNWTERRERYRALLDGDRCVYPGSVFDPISARIAEDLGFEVGQVLEFAGSIVGRWGESLETLRKLPEVDAVKKSETKYPQ